MTEIPLQLLRTLQSVAAKDAWAETSFLRVDDL